MNTLHDTLAAHAQATETTAYDTADIASRLDDIHDWYPQLAHTMLHLPATTPDLTGIRSTTNRIPGGDALAMLAPWAPDADHGDDLPHPHQIITEWANRWRTATHTPTPPHARWADHLAILRANNTWYIRRDTSHAYRTDIRTLWHHLARLTGNHPLDTPTPQRTTSHVWDALRDHPNHLLTRQDLTHLGIPASTLRTWRHRGHLTPTPDGHYRAADILNLRPHP